MKDYILAVTDLVLFRDSLQSIESDLVVIDEESSTVNLNIPKALVHYNNNQSVAIVRTTPEYLAEAKALESVVLVGEAKEQFIKSNGDVVWLNENLYHAIYDITPKTYTDDFGNEQTYTRPKLHCVLAS